jgi:hypothetical protein
MKRKNERKIKRPLALKKGFKEFQKRKQKVTCLLAKCDFQ